VKEKVVDGHGSCDGSDKGGDGGGHRKASTAVDLKVGWRFFAEVK
jgi:hypothetical protein